MTRKTVLILVLGLVATSCLLSTAIAKPKDSSDKTKATRHVDGKAVFEADGRKVVVTPGEDVEFRCNGKDIVISSGSELIVGGRSRDDDKAIRQERNHRAQVIMEMKNHIDQVNMEITQCQLNKEHIFLDQKDPKLCDKLIKEENAKIIDLKRVKARKLFELQTIQNKQPVKEASGSSTWARPNRELIKLQQTRQMLESIIEVAFDPISAGMIGIGAINDELALTPKEAAEELESILKSTKSLGLRNAIRMTLKDVYLKAGDKKRASYHMGMMIAESDKFLTTGKIKNVHGKKNKK